MVSPGLAVQVIQAAEDARITQSEFEGIVSSLTGSAVWIFGFGMLGMIIKKFASEYGGSEHHSSNPTDQLDAKLKAIHDMWRELDTLQIKLHMDCMSPRKWAVLNSLDAIGLELTKPNGYPAIGPYIDEKMETIERALKDLRAQGEIVG